jgi:hypothetical protein
MSSSLVSIAYLYIIFAALMGQLPAMLYYIIAHSAVLVPRPAIKV